MDNFVLDKDIRLPYALLDKQTVNRYKAVLITRVLSGCEVITLPFYVRDYGLIKFLEDVFPNKKFIREDNSEAIHECLLFNEDKDTIYCLYENQCDFMDSRLLDIYGHNVCHLSKDYDIAYNGGDA